ncbi:UbiA prenyltransferase family-domain-containing protein [Tuber indicum]|nr:UbiA prenyltransferase family-domain-containing protein [Tuber indicum]
MAVRFPRLGMRAPSQAIYQINRTPSRLSPRNLTTVTRPSSILLHKPLPNAISRISTTTATTTPPTSQIPPEIYEPPKSGLLSHFPRKAIPYAELIRLDKPTGTIYLFLPCLWSTLLAGTLTDPVTPLPTVLGTTFLFATGALIMRGAGCTINDILDRNIDLHVSRTKFRPIARGAITPFNALAFTCAQLLAGLAVLVQFPAQTIIWGIPSLAVVTVYPLMKRATHYPQFVLGLAFSWGALLGFPALGLGLDGPVMATAACLYGSNVAWTVVYDIVYAHQDVRDDVKAGVKSIVVKHEAYTKYLMSALGAAQVGLLAGAGAVAGCGPVFYLVSCGGAAGSLAYMIRKVNLKDVKECWYYFKWCAWAVGFFAVGGGLFGEYMAVRSGLYGEEGLWGLGGSRHRALQRVQNKDG